jgi:hypothetical protein
VAPQNISAGSDRLMLISNYFSNFKQLFSNVAAKAFFRKKSKLSKLCNATGHLKKLAGIDQSL